jgi:uncharacterized membrane protein
MAMPWFKAYGAALVAFLVLDAVWIWMFVRNFYDARIGDWMRDKPNMAVAGIFYLTYIAGVVYLAVRPGLAANSLATTLTHGAVVGALAYGTYTLTNYIILKDWTPGLVVTDIAWGAFLTALVAAAGHLAARG